MTPDHVPGLAELQGRKLAAVHHAHRLLQWAAVAPTVLDPVVAVERARKLLLQDVLPPRPAVSIPHLRHLLPVQR